MSDDKKELKRTLKPRKGGRVELPAKPEQRPVNDNKQKAKSKDA